MFAKFDRLGRKMSLRMLVCFFLLSLSLLLGLWKQQRI